MLNKMKNIIITGGAGYIGSHVAVSLLENNYNVIIIDNFSNSYLETIQNIEKITRKKITLFTANVNDKSALQQVFKQYEIYAVIHLAGYKSVLESQESPLTYYDNNLTTTITLLEVMKENNCHKIVFSSSATVYGNAQLPLTEDKPLTPVSPYGKTKAYIENILSDLAASDPTWRIVILRYFNPVASHSSGLLVEKSKGKVNNLFPNLINTDFRTQPFNIYGNDYPTPDGTCQRDYIHITDLALAHLTALEKINQFNCEVFNIGTGVPYSVKLIVEEFEKAIGFNLNKIYQPRRTGDVAVSCADVNKAFKVLGFKAQRDIKQMCADAAKTFKDVHNLK